MKTIAFLLVIVCSGAVLAQNQHISAFKNGTAFFVKKLKVSPTNGVYTLKEVPQATFGTLWFYAPNNQIQGIQSTTEKIGEKKEIKNLYGTLQGNMGKKLLITLLNDKSYEGIVESLSETLLSFRTTQGKWLQMDYTQVKMIELLEAPAKEFTDFEQKRILQLNFAKNTPSQELEMMYLQKGISWVPSYAIELLSDTKASMLLSATLLNDVEDLENATLNFVVGVPNFAYDYLQSPLTSTQDLLSFINTLNRYSNQFGTGSLSRADITRQSMSNVASNDFETEEALAPVEMEGTEAEDLFFYNAQNVSLKKGGRALLDVLQTDIDYQHIYEVNIPTNTENSYAYTREFAEESRISNVWHSIRLKNDSRLPWTTGTVMVTKKIGNIQKALSQDKLSYIPIGGKGKVKLTIAPNISVKDSERELTREENKKKKETGAYGSGNIYDLVTVEAKIEIKNYKNQDVRLNITRRILGESQKSNEKWEVRKLVSIYNAINPNQELDWEIDIPAGKTKEIIYQYQVYVRR
jgi:hypothetical protein